MGIKNLKNLIKKYSPNSITQVHLSNYRLKKFAVDVSLYLFRAKARANSKGDPSQWILDFIYIVCSLRRHNIHPIFVYDTKSPQEKDETRKDRASKKQSTKDRVKHLSSLVENYYRTGEPCQELQKMVDNTDQILLEEQEKVFDIRKITSKIEKLKTQIIDVSIEDFILTQQLFDILNVPYISATTEAEKTCSFLCKFGIVDAVLTEDSDVLAYGSNLFLYNIDTVNDTVMQIDYSKVLEEMELTDELFLDLCILCGSDYNNNIKGIGPEKSFQLVRTVGSIEKISEKMDTSVLNYNKVRSIFRDYEEEPKVHFKYTGDVDFEKLKEFVEENSLGINTSIVLKSFEKEKVNLV